MQWSVEDYRLVMIIKLRKPNHECYTSTEIYHQVTYRKHTHNYS